ncbi:MAG: sigma-70 family RNA polymerase sigma factor [Bacteroidota bacterium]
MKEAPNEHIDLSKDAFKALFHEHYRFLFAIAIKMGADRELAKDVIQSLFLGLWERRNRLQEVQHWRAYLKKALERDLIRAFTKQQQNQPIEETPLKDTASPSYESLLIQKERGKETVKDLQKALNRLPEQEKQVLKMRFQEGLSYDEIAASTGKSKQTVYNQIHSAIKRLKDVLLCLLLIQNLF